MLVGVGVGAPFSSFPGVASGLSVSFGDLTLAGNGGKLVSAGAASIAEGDPLGHWQILPGGVLTPSVAGAGNLSGPYSLVLDNDAEVTVNVVPGVYTVQGANELLPFANGTHAFFTGGFISVRGGNYDIAAWRGRTGSSPAEAFMHDMFAGLGPTYIMGEDPNDMPVFNAWQPHGTGATVVDGEAVNTVRNLHLSYVRVASQQIATTAPLWGIYEVQSVVRFMACDTCSITHCEIEGDIAPIEEGGYAYSLFWGVRIEEQRVPGEDVIATSAIDVSHNRISKVQTGVSVRAPDCTIEYNNITQIHGGDFIVYSTLAHRMRARCNHFDTPTGDQTRRHPDGFQQTITPGSDNAEDVLIELNVLALLTKGRPFYEAGDNIAGSRNFIIFSSKTADSSDSRFTDPANWQYQLVAGTNVDLTLAEAHCDIRLDCDDGATLGATLPAAAASDEAVFSIRGMNQNASHPITFQGGDGSDVAIPAPEFLRTPGVGFRSDGSNTWRDYDDQRMYFERQVRGNTAVDAEEEGLGFVMGVEPGDQVVTLPSLADALASAVAASGRTPDWRVNVRVSYPALGTYGIAAPAGSQIRMPDGSLVQSIPMIEGKSWRLVASQSDGVYIAQSRDGVVQPIFGNNGMTRPIIRYNIINGNAGNGIIMQGGMEDGLIHDNVAFNAPEPGEDTMLPFVLSSVGANGLPCLAWRNAVLGGRIQTDAINAPSSPGAEFGNYTIAGNQDLSVLFDIIGGAVSDDLRAATMAEAIEIMRPLATAAAWLDGTFALGPTDAEGRINTATRSVNVANLDNPILQDATPPAGSTTPAPAEIVLSFNHPIARGVGSIEIWNETDAISLGSFDVATAPEIAIENFRNIRLTHGLTLPSDKVIGVRMASGVLVSRAYQTPFAGLAANDLSFSVEAGASLPVFPLVNIGPTGDIAVRDNFSSAAYVPGKSLTLNKLLMAFEGSPGYGDFRDVLFFNSQLNFRAQFNDQLYMLIENMANTRDDLLPASSFKMIYAYDGTQTTAAAGHQMWIDDVEQDTSTWQFFANREVDLAGQPFDLLRNPAFGNRHYDGDIRMLYLDQPATIPDLSDPAERAKFDAPTLTGAAFSDDWSGAPNGVQPHTFLFGDAAEYVDGTAQRGSGAFP